ncbi:putative nuclease HARBI1 [Anoplophora glabripennis]|uniref:putative nuclease HARBI1 n=1 Tax=Anoplophora glabripennis TaxID=217634 RepID=UPI000C77A132|nr:putative nuclease HARBI1 [Anoplophora glabripennis]
MYYYNIISSPFMFYFNCRYHEIDAMDQLLLTLRYYATGSFYITVGDFVGVYKTTAGRIIRRVTEALVSLRPNYIKFPRNEDEMRIKKQGFYQLARFPRVLGAIDCTHIRIQSPGGDNAEFFRNRKNFFSINVQVVSDSNNMIMDIVARWPGSSHDSNIFQNSIIRRRFEYGDFGNAVLLGDSGYPLRDYLMTPLAETRSQQGDVFNVAEEGQQTETTN